MGLLRVIRSCLLNPLEDKNTPYKPIKTLKISGMMFIGKTETLVDLELNSLSRT